MTDAEAKAQLANEANLNATTGSALGTSVASPLVAKQGPNENQGNGYVLPVTAAATAATTPAAVPKPAPSVVTSDKAITQFNKDKTQLEQWSPTNLNPNGATTTGGVTTTSDGWTMTPDGKWYPPKGYNADNTKKEETQTSSSSSTQGASTSAAQSLLDLSNNELDKEISDTQAQYDRLKANADAQLQATIDSIKASYAKKAEAMKETNASISAVKEQAGYRSGRARYAPEMQGNIISEEGLAAQKRLSEIDDEMNMKINAAKLEAQGNDIKALNASINAIAELRKEKVNAAFKAQTIAQQEEAAATAKAKAISDEKKTELANQVKAREFAMSNGITTPFYTVGGAVVDTATGELVDAKAMQEQLGMSDEEFNAINWSDPNNGIVDVEVAQRTSAGKSDDIQWISATDNQPAGYFNKKTRTFTPANVGKTPSSTDTPSDFASFTDEQIALSALPVQTRNSDTELKRALTGIRAGLAEGKTPYEIADNLMGYKIKNPDTFSATIRNYISQSEKLDANAPSSFSRLINNGDKKGVVTKLETTLLGGVGSDGKKKESVASYTSSAGDKTIDLISQNLKSLGIVQGNWNTLKKKFVEDKNFQKISSSLASVISEWRHQMVGSAATDNELRMIDELIPSVKDNPFNAIEKIKALQEMTLAEANAQRSNANLPTLGKTTLNDLSARTSLYDDRINFEELTGEDYNKNLDEMGAANMREFLNQNKQSNFNEVVPDTKTGETDLKDKTVATNDNGKITVNGESYDIKSYATDPAHEANVTNILNKIGKLNSVGEIDSYIKKVAPNSPITGEMVRAASEKYGVSWEMIVAIMQQDSTLGTKGKAVSTFNPGNVGNTDSGATRKYGSWDAGVDAVAKNLAWRKIKNNA